MSYESKVISLIDPSFDTIRVIAVNEISHLAQTERNRLWDELNRGTALLQTNEHMCQYMFSFGKMHQAKLLDAYKRIPLEVLEKEIEIIDWGCGQALGTVVFFDHIKKHIPWHQIKKITLIEPSAKALERASLHVSSLIGKDDVELVTIADFFEHITPQNIETKSDRSVMHIFSNILDVVAIDLKHLANLIDSSVVSDNYLVCVGPLNPTNLRIDAFFRYFNEEEISNLYACENTNFYEKGWTYKARIYKLERNQAGHLIPIEYYPTVQFHAAYELDIVRAYRQAKKTDWSSLTQFEVAAPFDLGASVYDDVHPVLAVLNNIICRGLPTRSSVFLENSFRAAFDLSGKSVENGEIKYKLNNGSDINIEPGLVEKYLNNDSNIESGDLVALQLLLTPIAIARFQKVLIEAIITEHLAIQKDKWTILVEEQDVPFAHLAIEDFKNTFGHLTSLSQDYDDYRLPYIELHIISNKSFSNSKLQPSQVYDNATAGLLKTEFDLVITNAILKTDATDIESFSGYKAINKCYFNIRSAQRARTKRLIYTSSPIKYKNIVDKNRQGVYSEKEDIKSHLTYFLQLFFRKDVFRPGQLPILDRALQNLPVIGLLPTGGGKSLTYQISALLQPGVTIIIDPLKSLMKDQFDGLINSGIDTAAFINSTQSKEERQERERQLESSELQFIFLSPERLSIASFRERLKNMHNYNVYFSYGVIDEVHCVSEWGHDFRFSYLHLGRNLYNYVRAKDKEISLLGLTATASFDVLADVERELSGNGAFALDADVIVRHENTNRLELQYKIEKVPVDFEPDKYYDAKHDIAPHLPKAVNPTYTKVPYLSKATYLKGYYKQIPSYLNELQVDANISLIKHRFNERQNTEEVTNADLKIATSSDYFTKKDEYTEAGIVFCSHVQTTGISVAINTDNLRINGVTDVASFSGRDDDNSSMDNLELFRTNKSPIMVATKAFGMGIDKPNVRFTVNMNYSGSLESFVQEAGRAGRDRKIALSTILVSDYTLVQISRTYGETTHPLPILRNKWFKEEDLNAILNYYSLQVPKEYIVRATPGNDIVKLHCSKDNVMFGFGRCDNTCSEFNRCTLRKVDPQTKGWKSELDLLQELNGQNLNLSKKNYQYVNPDYQAVMFFFNESFKGDVVEKSYMHQLLSITEVDIKNANGAEELIRTKGFLTSLRSAGINTEIVVYIPYSDGDRTDLSKAIYRMTCIELIEDFTQDYANSLFRIVTKRKENGSYYQGLKKFLLRYYTEERAGVELEKVQQIELKVDDLDPMDVEIYKCLSYLTEFVYDKISVKRKRAIDDMRSFCMEGLDETISWVERNENLKDFIYYYFNSKYAKSDYVADSGEAFSLVLDTDGGKVSSIDILFKYLRVINDDIVSVGTPLDNVKHLYGAVRLISRSLTDSNPALYLLEVFCLAYMGTKNNSNLEEQLVSRYSEGMTDFSQRFNDQKQFWKLFLDFNLVLGNHLKPEDLKTLVDETSFLIHSNQLRTIKNNLLEIYE